MEQVEGYDYKADIWSFGITALELAKGFAPYAFHPPMKVLLLTIQEEAPSLRSYATEKSCTGASFSRPFKEMVRMCLQKEARKRPTVHTLLNCKFYRTKWPVQPIVDELLCHISDISVLDESSPPEIYPKEHRAQDNTNKDGNVEVTQHSLARRNSNQVPKPPEANISTEGSGEFARGTTWTFDDSHGIVLKSESYIKQEIDAKCAQDDQECAAIFDDLEDLMHQRGGEWDFKKNRDVHACDAKTRSPPDSSPPPPAT
jgi:serine/threonine-protein kinase OSR1/STK39